MIEKLRKEKFRRSIKQPVEIFRPSVLGEYDKKSPQHRAQVVLPIKNFKFS
jgi:hypothetical protein